MASNSYSYVLALSLSVRFEAVGLITFILNYKKAEHIIWMQSLIGGHVYNTINAFLTVNNNV